MILFTAKCSGLKPNVLLSHHKLCLITRSLQFPYYRQKSALHCEISVKISVCSIKDTCRPGTAKFTGLSSVQQGSNIYLYCWRHLFSLFLILYPGAFSSFITYFNYQITGIVFLYLHISKKYPQYLLINSYFKPIIIWFNIP